MVGKNISNENVFRSGAGVDIQLRKKRWSAGATYLHQYARYMDYRRSFIQENRVVPSMNVTKGTDRLRTDFITAYINYKTKSIFDLELGYGRNFIGDGYRSLFLSDNTKSSPYFRTSAQFWKIQYSMLINIYQDIFQIEGLENLYRKKYTATHYLDWKVNNWFSLGLFESIVWQHQEQNFERGFDVNYLNPVIFFRPVEFSVGSSDNAFVGTNMKFSPVRDHHFYFQLVFDEFLLDEIRADIEQWLKPDEDIRSGWWANKYGIQIGWKAFDPFNIKGLRTQFEYNVVRPFTYSHSSPTQSYSNFNMPLAHPLGANFREFVSRFSYHYGNWNFLAQWNYYQKGFSTVFSNQGENLQISNTTRTSDFENEITQGLKHKVNYLELNASYLIKEEWNTSLGIGFVFRNENGENIQSFDNQMISISLSSNLFNQYFDL